MAGAEIPTAKEAIRAALDRERSAEGLRRGIGVTSFQVMAKRRCVQSCPTIGLRASPRGRGAARPKFGSVRAPWLSILG
jgi:hypothetical protein